MPIVTKEEIFESYKDPVKIDPDILIILVDNLKNLSRLIEERCQIRMESRREDGSIRYKDFLGFHLYSTIVNVIFGESGNDREIEEGDLPVEELLMSEEDFKKLLLENWKWSEERHQEWLVYRLEQEKNTKKMKKEHRKMLYESLKEEFENGEDP